MKTANYTDLRNNLKGYLDTVVDDCEPLIIHRSSNASVVVISLEEYNAIKETAHLTSSSEMMKRIRSAEKSIKNGAGKKINIADL
ncbi:MAG: type II toxin-antitoxin system prevent-host-death family antitoxin [Dysgonamonadaceae bacterium]|jgi:antitoxin YefM|nr:type II toxin-antitoxin system prevent-host-death family antitoxin [Dysgonamonadaceae bacterium]